MDNTIVTNNLLCFLMSARNDFTKETLLQVVDAFYSHEIVKDAKICLVDILHKDLVWRRDPGKKRKDLQDVMIFLKEAIAADKKLKFVCDSYKGMPPVGIEFIAPLIIKLNEDVAKINEVLPKFTDIRTEVINTADAVRQVRKDVTDLKQDFNSAIKGIHEITNDVSDELEILQDVRSFRMSITNEGEPFENIDAKGCDGIASPCYSEALTTGLRKCNRKMSNELAESLAEQAELPVSHDREHDVASGSDRNCDSDEGMSDEGGDSAHSHLKQGGWTLVEKRKKSPIKKVTNRREQEKSYAGNGKRGNYKVTGVKKISNNSFKGVRKTVDVFVGRVNTDVQVDDIRNYIGEIFQINILNIEQLDIRSQDTKAFKITVYLDERDCLFNSESWPDGVIVNKYYKKKVFS